MCTGSPARAELTRPPANAMRRTMRIVCILLTTHVDFLSALRPTRMGTIPLTTGRSLARLLRYDGLAAKTSPEMRKGILSVCRRQRYGTERNRTDSYAML